MNDALVDAPARAAPPQRPAARSVRQRLGALVLAVLLPAIAVSLIASYLAYAEARRSVIAAALETAKALSLVTDREFAYRAGVLRTLAASSTLDRGDLRGFHEQARAVAPTFDSSIVLLDPQGRELLHTRQAYGAPALPRSPLFRFDDPGGRVAHEVSNLYMAPISRQYSFAVRVPVLRDGNLRWYVSMGSFASGLQRIFEQQPLPPGWTGTVVDARGAVVARNIQPEATRGRTATPDMLRRLAADRHGVHETTTLDGTPVVTVFARTPDSGWSVLIGVPRAQLYQAAFQALSVVGLASLLFCGFAVWAVRRVGGSITEPVARLQADAEALGRDELVVERPTGLRETDTVQQSLAQASRELREAEARLQRRVREAVAEAEQAQQRVLGVQKLEALGRLTGGIAHDFNNLLQTMSTGIKVAALLSADERARNALAACERAVDKAVRLTRQLLTFGTSQPGHLEVVDLRRQLQELRDLLRGALPESIAVSFEVDQDVWPVELDPVQMELAILNLAMNARDAIEGAGQMKVAARNCRLGAGEVPGTQPGDFVAITVSDDGHGIPPELMVRVFEPFFTTKPVGKGTGIGLAQVHGFARQLGGGVGVESRQGEGTRVTLFLPRSLQSPDGPPPAAAGPAGSAPCRGTVLLVEDDALVRGLTAEALEGWGYTVLVAGSADDALAIAGGPQAIDAVLSDVVMPGSRSGLDLLEALCTLRPGLPVVLASGYAEALSGELPVPVLAKPYDIDEVARLLSRQIAAAAGG